MFASRKDGQAIAKQMVKQNIAKIPLMFSNIEVHDWVVGKVYVEVSTIELQLKNKIKKRKLLFEEKMIYLLMKRTKSQVFKKVIICFFKRKRSLKECSI